MESNYNDIVRCTIKLDAIGLVCGHTGIPQTICCVDVNEHGG